MEFFILEVTCQSFPLGVLNQLETLIEYERLVSSNVEVLEFWLQTFRLVSNLEIVVYYGLLVALEELFIISHQYVYKRIQVLPVPDGRRCCDRQR